MRVIRGITVHQRSGSAVSTDKPKAGVANESESWTLQTVVISNSGLKSLQLKYRDDGVAY